MQKKEEDEKKVEQLDAQIQQVQQEYSCYDGKLFVIPQKRKWILTLCLIHIPTILHSILHLQWFSHLHYFGALYVLFISQFFNLWTFINLCLEDPGFIQRIKYGYEIDQDFTKIPKNQNINNHLPISFVVIGKQQTQRIKLCSTCNIYRPLRTSHCGECGACIERMDHHCPWVGTCIGKRNYKYFYFFLLSLLVLLITVMVMCIMIMVGSQDDPNEFGDRLKIYPFSIILILFPCVEGLFFVGILFGFHTYLLTIDQTTKQFFDEKWVPQLGNPQKKRNCLKSFIKIMFRVKSSNNEYKHKAFPYYNAQPESSSNTNNRNSKGSSDPENPHKKQQNNESSMSEQSMAKHREADQNNANVQNIASVQTQNKIVNKTKK